ncbi:MAG TPA: LysR family transcriptional regulator [Candidatus Eubacterium avistercoris]|uniref:LysR family transcriptional regulator n=1 Tax=Candidatus Eubacterium avistercoris TaxID=2838567 RepID=A0A9D2D216_9FIRM|nr:LysR family transcriptional regulator [Candidatus Eubacterium avistercoris]
MNSLQIKYFLTAARTLNFTEAAAQLYISQPALSQQISALEKELNMQLFIRSKKKVYLTPAAVVLLDELPDYARQYEDILARARMANEGNSGIIRLGVLQGQCMEESLLKGYFAFRREHPNIAFDVSSYSFGKLKDQLDAKELDLIYTASFDIQDRPDYMYEVTGKNVGVAIISRYHPLAEKKITDLSQLKEETIITVQNIESQEVNRMIREDCRQAGFIPNLRNALSLDEEYLLVEMGMGIGIANQNSIACSNPNIKILKDLKIGENRFVLCWKKENPNPAVALFINFLRKKQNP